MMNRSFTLVLAVLLAAGTVPPAVLGADAGPAAARWPVRPLAEVARHLAPDLDRAALDREDLDRQEQGLPYRFADVQEVALDPEGAGTWESLPSGRDLWRLRITARDVLSLNLGFSRFWLPPGARMLLYPASEQGPVLSFDESDNAPHGELWTPVVLGDELVVELEVDPAFRWQVELELTSIGRGYRFFGEDPADKSGSCNIDVVCPEGDDWRKEIDTVGVYSMGGSTLCTGFMTNNTAEDGKPFFMTAYHCNVRAAMAPRVVVYWNFQSPSCGQQGGGLTGDNQSGATLRAEWITTDFTLLELDEIPDPSFGVKYAGWNRGMGVPTAAVAIHHPSTDEKSISFEDDPLSVTTYREFVSPGDGTHLRIDDWDLGTTEPGSSGSPLFDQDHHVVGQLHGGAAACGNNESDWYGWFHVSWDGGGASTNSLREWLDPQGTGVETVETIDPNGTSFAVTPTEGFSTIGVMGGPFDPDKMVYTLANTGDLVAQFTASSPVAWLSVNPSEGSIPVGGSVEVTVSLGPDAGILSEGLHASTLDIVNKSHGGGSTSIPVTVDVFANLRVGPNPFVTSAVSETKIFYTLGGPATVTGRIHNIRGDLVRDLGSQTGDVGVHYFTWNGTGFDGARPASGTYVFILDAAGREERISIMLIH